MKTPSSPPHLRCPGRTDVLAPHPRRRRSRPTGVRRQVAIVGCGPAGCYTAQAILRLAPDARITVFDARPTPFGLVRYGVAADHQGMKNVTKQFERIFASDRVEFVGNTRIGEEIGLAELEQNFDAVVLATGLPEDRPLAVPVTGAARVIGAGQLLRFLNGDPDSLIRTGGPTRLGGEVVVIGAGNVAMDVARLLCKTTTDLTDQTSTTMHATPWRRRTFVI
ncbi:MAG: FAD-dependent oxidoreductase [Mycobacterium kyogaense]|uniref:FAD-dependent oxidoreductase n=1 Tax=Mycobacterium kyogaense TaxID=2212479 RepID=UPI002FFC06B8